MDVEHYDEDVTWRLQTREELVAENSLFFQNVIGRAPEYGRQWVMEYIASCMAEIEEIGDPGSEVSQRVTLTRVGGGLSFFAAISRTRTFTASDPINLVFWNHGIESIVTHHLAAGVGGWAPTPGNSMWAWINDAGHGGPASFRPATRQLRKGAFLGRSSHVRMYDGFTACTHGKGLYALAAVHKEKLALTHALTHQPLHEITSWNSARDEIVRELRSLPVATGTYERVQITPSGVAQAVAFDGQVGYLELSRPPWIAGI